MNKIWFHRFESIYAIQRLKNWFKNKCFCPIFSNRSMQQIRAIFFRCRNMFCPSFKWVLTTCKTNIQFAINEIGDFVYCEYHVVFIINERKNSYV